MVFTEIVQIKEETEDIWKNWDNSIFLSLLILRAWESDSRGGAERGEAENLKQGCGVQTQDPGDHDLSQNQESDT